jgi:hypothetical protein
LDESFFAEDSLIRVATHEPVIPEDNGSLPISDGILDNAGNEAFERKQEKVDLKVFVVTRVIHTDSVGQVSCLVTSLASGVAEFVDSSFVAATVVDFEHVQPLGDWELVEMGKEMTIRLLENRPEASTVGSFETLEDSSFVLCHYQAL